MMTSEGALVRIYVMDAKDLVSKDYGHGLSDPYLVIKLGSKEYNDHESTVYDTTEPDFYKSFDFDTRFPGSSQLIIQIWDKDDFF
jgi:Ca2+-dependent lipid-binding protein